MRCLYNTRMRHAPFYTLTLQHIPFTHVHPTGSHFSMVKPQTHLHMHNCKEPFTHNHTPAPCLHTYILKHTRALCPCLHMNRQLTSFKHEQPVCPVSIYMQNQQTPFTYVQEVAPFTYEHRTILVYTCTASRSHL